MHRENDNDATKWFVVGFKTIIYLPSNNTAFMVEDLGLLFYCSTCHSWKVVHEISTPSFIQKQKNTVHEGKHNQTNFKLKLLLLQKINWSFYFFIKK